MSGDKRVSSLPIDTFIHLVAGGTAGTAGAIVTCPLEVVKTRLQSSNSGFGAVKPKSAETNGGNQVNASSQAQPKGESAKFSSLKSKSLPRIQQLFGFSSSESLYRSFGAQGHPSAFLRGQGHFPEVSLVRYFSTAQPGGPGVPSMNVFQCLKYIVDTEGPRGLFRGLGPNLVGVAPSRAIYFFTYSTVKKEINNALPKKNRETPFVHVISAFTAGFCASTCTNPLWLVKTRLQLDRASKNQALNVRKCVQNIYRQKGIKGFWKGVTASYWGISETVIHFVIYEFLRKRLSDYQKTRRKSDEKNFLDFAGAMLCGACSKTVATIVAYPHEVARTRLREVGTKYQSFWQTLLLVAREEGRSGLYRGLVTQLIRQIPNTAIMMATYELTVYVMSKNLKPNDRGGSDDDDDS